MARVTAQEGAQKWRDKFSQFAATARTRIQNIRKNPMELALAQGDKWRQKMMLQSTYEKWQNGLRRRSRNLQAWKDQLIAGLEGVTPKLDVAQQRYQEEAIPLYAYQDDAVRRIDSELPRGDLERNIQRSAAMIRAMSNYVKGGLPGGG